MDTVRCAVLIGCFAALAAVPTQAQQVDLSESLKVVRLEAQPARLKLEAGQEAPLKVIALDADGNPVNAPVRASGVRGALRVRRGTVTAITAGEHEVTAALMLPPDAGREPVVLKIPVTVTWPAAASLEVVPDVGSLYEGTTLGHTVTVKHADGTTRPNAMPGWESSDPAVATVDRFGNVTGVQPGEVTITASFEQLSQPKQYTVKPLDATGLEIRVSAGRARTGDVLAVDARVNAPDGGVLTDVPVTWSYTFAADDSIHASGAAGLVSDGKFVAEVPGTYTLLAQAGGLHARKTVDIRPRKAVREVQLMGQGSVNHVHTSDLWIYEGNDGRDYAVTGTWGADGYAYFWDVTDPTHMVKTDSIHVDARTVNDVKVSPDARYAALSREGASNRRNGVVILDLADPGHPTIASVYDDGLTGGVHNMFATEDYLFALSAGEKYVIIDVRDLANPTYVSEYDHPESRVHDVWVHDGVAYSSEWGTGVVVVDVGNGKWGGSIDNPKLVTTVPYPVGATHASFPYFQESTGKFYLFLGDEIMARGGKAWSASELPRIPQEGGPPGATSGYYHIIDFTDPENPKDVARYHVEEFGTHNLWVEDDVLYTAYYEGGLRVVDVSGELMGNLGEQGREIAVFKPFDPNGFVANAPMTWGPQPHKGYVFFSDFNSGLWAVKLQPRRETT